MRLIKQTEENLPGNEVATTSPAHTNCKVYLIGLFNKTFSAPKPRNATLENKMEMIVEEDNSNLDVAHWQARPAEYEHFHGY